MGNREERIAQMVEDARKAIPHLNTRADKAADLLSTVFFLGKQSGVDWWQVGDDHRASYAGKTCSCTDSKEDAPRHDKNGKYIGPVCKHRLAIMFEMKIRKQNAETLAAILSRVKDAGGAAKLYVSVAYTGIGRPDEWAVKGYFIPGSSRVMFGDFPSDWLAIGADELVQALVVAGLRVIGKQKSVGRDYVWSLALAVPEDANPDIRIGVLNSMDQEYVEHQQVEAYFNNLLKAQLLQEAR